MDKPSAVSDGGPDAISSNTDKTSNHQHAPRSTTKPAAPAAATSTAAATATDTTSSTPNGVSTSPSKQSSASNSAVPSPNASRDASPSRYVRKATSASRLTGSRSRHNSHQEPSPTRPSRSQIPTHTASTRSLSTSAAPALNPSSREPSDPTATPAKSAVVSDLKDSPKWPVSPRLRSPAPNLPKPTTTPTRTEPEPPAISVQQPSPAVKPVDSQPTPTHSESETDEPNSASGIRTPVRGGLETVQEVATPARSSDLLDHVKEKLPPAEAQSDTAASDGGRTLRARPNLPSADSGSESTADRRPTSVPSPAVPRQPSAMSAKQGKTKPEGSTQTMTVETETVSSIPQVALTTSAKTDGTNGTLKPKPSTETIKPKKDKKKTTRKQPSAPGTSSSKADNFEAKIASAVDEANTSDSEETFVYDSNPPDGGDRTVRRFHSRTPSATSMASQADRQNVRSIYGVMEGHGHHHGPVPKKSMKFVNTFNGSGNESLTPGDEDGKGTGRSAGGSGRGTTRHHHHIGRWGRQPGNGHPSLFDNESPFPNAAKSKLSAPNSRNSSGGPTSPRNHHSARNLTTKRSALQMSSIYDMDDTGGADDERTPLLGSTRIGRSGRGRRGPHSLRQAESQTYTRRSSYLNRFAACLVLTMMFLLVITGAIGFMFATSQPMTNIEIVSIQNVVTSEQLLMFDVTVNAHNPNIVAVTIDHANLEIFAKSEHAGTDSDWWRAPNPANELKVLDDPINDPPSDGDEDSRPNILLGRITEFDSQLQFEGSMFHQGTSSSTAGMQLAEPGNSTSGGTKRWDLIYQNEFDLIIKGVLKYSLPLSAHIRSATVSGRTTVKPNSANDPSLQPNSTNSHE
ncbi:Vacuolar inheritance and morphology protein [Lecanicillium sp. MT-2017a]|nr:Vacuolar inheritance and morphology protein [Lecanicillium sp. MT-2017a]